MAKIQKIFKNTTSFAGVYLVNDEFSRSGLVNLIDNQLGIRSSTCGYTYSNLFRNFFNLFLSGGECAEDLQQHFRPTLEQIPGNKVASADTLLRCFSELATENTVVVSPSGKEYRFNINEKLNDLNIKSLLLRSNCQKLQIYTFSFKYSNEIFRNFDFRTVATALPTTTVSPKNAFRKLFLRSLFATGIIR